MDFFRPSVYPDLIGTSSSSVKNLRLSEVKLEREIIATIFTALCLNSRDSSWNVDIEYGLC